MKTTQEKEWLAIVDDNFTEDIQSRIKELLEKYGDGTNFLSIMALSALLFAKKKNKIIEVLERLESFYVKTIQYQHPGIRDVHISNTTFLKGLIKDLQ